MKEIIENTKSQISKEFIKELYDKVIENEFDYWEIYSSYNGCTTSGFKQHGYINGVNSSELIKFDDIGNIISSPEIEPQLIRIYLNIEPSERRLFLSEFKRRIEENKLTCDYKYTIDYLGYDYNEERDRKDNFVIYSSERDINGVMNVVKDLEKIFTYNEPSQLVGKYRNNIGVCSETYIYKEESYTTNLLKDAVAAFSNVIYNNPELKDIAREKVKEDIAPYVKEDYGVDTPEELSKEDMEHEIRSFLSISDIDMFYDKLNSYIDGKADYEEESKSNHYSPYESRGDYKTSGRWRISDFAGVLKDNKELYLESFEEEFRNLLERDGFSRDGVFRKELEERFKVEEKVK